MSINDLADWEGVNSLIGPYEDVPTLLMPVRRATIDEKADDRSTWALGALATVGVVVGLLVSVGRLAG